MEQKTEGSLIWALSQMKAGDVTRRRGVQWGIRMRADGNLEYVFIVRGEWWLCGASNPTIDLALLTNSSEDWILERTP